MENIAVSPKYGRLWLACLIFVPLAFFVLCSNRIEEQGLYYDELHQAPAAFMLIGKEPYIFAPVSWQNIPLLTMPYGGAIKSVIYGVWMKWTGSPFTIRSWRSMGILLVILGLVLFYGGARHGLTSAGLLLFSFLFLTDITILMTSRHDWGPTALSMGLRLAWLGVWIKMESASSIRPADAFFFGLLPAVSLYEKLSNVVLIAPLALVICLTGNEYYRRFKFTILSGLLVGLIPLLWVNVVAPGISFEVALDSGRSSDYMHIFAQAPNFLMEMIKLGAGDQVRSFILDYGVPAWIQLAEATFMATFLVAAVIISVFHWRKTLGARLILLSASSYFLAAILTWMLPKETWINHWIIATPFQYLALGLLPSVVRSLSASMHPRGWTYSLLPIAAMVFLSFLLSRTVNLWDTQVALGNGLASGSWDPSYSRIARFAANHSEDGNFVLADWGFATAIFALSHGSLPLAEPFWDYRKPQDLLPALSRNPGKPVYVLSRRFEKPVNPAATEKIIRDVKQMASGRDMPIEDEIAALRSVQVLKLTYPVNNRVRVTLANGLPTVARSSGYIDQINLDPANSKRVKLSGWALFDATNPHSRLRLHTELPVEVVDVAPVFRPDVAQKLGDTHAIARGFQVTLTLEHPVSPDVARQAFCLVSEDPDMGEFVLKNAVASGVCQRIAR